MTFKNLPKLVIEKIRNVSTIIEKILKNTTPETETENIELFLNNVLLFLKQAYGFELSEEDENYPAHPQFAHYQINRNLEVVDAIHRRLEIIHQYKIYDPQRIINIIVSATISPAGRLLTRRKIELLLELYQNPSSPRYQLAESHDTSYRIISKELRELRSQHGLSIVHHLDFHKFKLANYIIAFRSKSLDASEKLNQHFQHAYPTFLLQLSFDQDFRFGYMIYAFPDQPRGHRLFEERIRWFNDEFFEECQTSRIQGLHVTITFDGYNPEKGTWMLDADTISEAMLRFIRKQSRGIPQSRGLFYSKPMKFDKIDYLIANTSFGFISTRLKFKRDLLRRFGFDLSPKTIWKREQRLKSAGVFCPIVFYTIPGFEELVVLCIYCNDDAKERLRTLPSILPYAFLITLEDGIVVAFQRPTQCAEITGQLVKAISRADGISDVKTLRLEPTLTPMRAAHNVGQWDSSRQRWILKKNDI